MLPEQILKKLYDSKMPLSSLDMANKLDEDRAVINKAVYKLRTDRLLIERSECLKKYKLTIKGRKFVKDKYFSDDSVNPPEEIEVKQPKKEEEMPETKEEKEIDISGFSSVELAELHSELVNIEAKICSEVEDQDVKEIVLNSLIESTGGKVAEILESIRDNDVLR